MKFTFAPETRPLDGYTIKRAIHRGGFGEVYYALSDAGKEVALKLLNNNLDVELRGVSQCLNLKHPNLVTIFDIRQDADQDHWIVMEYVGGRGLHEVMQDHPAGMPVSEVLSWLSGITAGLSFLHDRGIVHRDLKPANVFSDDGIVKIGDVGLSKYISESRRSAQTQSVGTVYYMAPEVARGRYGREVDIYALGVMLVEMLTGHVPFDGETTAEILMKHLTADPDLSAVSPAIRPVLAAALEKDPSKRTGDADELERQFRLAVGQLSAKEFTFASAKPLPAADSSSRPAARENLNAALNRGRSVRERSMAGMAGTWEPTVRFWNERVPTPLKWIICGSLFLLIMESGVLRPVAAGGLVGGAAYLAWRAYLSIFGKSAPKSTGMAWYGEQSAAETAAVNLRPGQYDIPVSDGSVRQNRATVPQPILPSARTYTPVTVRRIPAGQKAVDITSSMSIALLAVVLVTTAVHLATDLLPQPAHVAFFGSVTLLAAWALIVPCKIWEGRPVDTVMRRLTLGSVGLGLGAVAWTIKEFLLLTDHALLHAGDGGMMRDIPGGRISIASPDGIPTIAGFMVFFGILFAARRWWWHIDSFRKSRFRVSSALFTLAVGAMLTVAMPFPEALGATWALAISAVVQLSAGWTPPEERSLLPAPDTRSATPSQAPARHPGTMAPRATT